MAEAAWGYLDPLVRFVVRSWSPLSFGEEEGRESKQRPSPAAVAAERRRKAGTFLLRKAAPERGGDPGRQAVCVQGEWSS